MAPTNTVPTLRKQPMREARSAKKIKDEPELPQLPKPKKIKTGDFFKDTRPDDSDPEVAATEDVDDFDYGKTLSKASKKRKAASTAAIKKAKKPKIARQPSPEIPDMSDMDDEVEREEDLRMFEKKELSALSNVKATVLPKVLRLEIRTAPTTININIADLLPKHASGPTIRTKEDLNGTTLLEHDVISRANPAEDFTAMRLNPKYACFLELEPELRNQIYREVLVVDKVVKFNNMPRLSRTTAVLRTCQQVHEEGRGILYGENAFHFDRTDRQRGNYWDEEWKEVGYKDVRRFLETIGQVNLAKIRYLSLHLSDAVPHFTPKLDALERRYQNDPVLHHVLRLIGRSGCVLEKFVVGFNGKAELGNHEVAFIRAFTSISCRRFIKSCSWGHSKIDRHLFSEMSNFMKPSKLRDVDLKKRKGPKMEDETRPTPHRHRGWGMRTCCSAGRRPLSDGDSDSE